MLDRFQELVTGEPVPLGEAALVAASVLGHRAPVAEGLDELQRLADEVAGDDLDAVCWHLFGTCGFHGNRGRYYDASNSLLPVVLAERQGIPVTLGVVVVEVARRRGIAADLACMPGHVLIADPADRSRWLDPFAGGAALDRAGAEARFRSVHGPGVPFLASYLDPTPDALVLGRLLGNLVAIFAGLGDARHLIRVHQLRYAIPALADDERSALAAMLELVGRWAEAADLWDLEAARLDGDGAEAAERRAQVALANLS